MPIEFAMLPQEDSEMNLICHILMDDSHWLDSFQASVLAKEEKTKEAEMSAVGCNSPQAIEMLSSSNSAPWESGHSLERNFNGKRSNHDHDVSKDAVTQRGLQRSKSTDSLPGYFGRRIITAPMTVVDQLPAPEFVAGTNSVIAAESMRMIAAVGSMRSRSGSLGNAHRAGERLNPYLTPGTSHERE